MKNMQKIFTLIFAMMVLISCNKPSVEKPETTNKSVKVVKPIVASVKTKVKSAPRLANQKIKLEKTILAAYDILAYDFLVFNQIQTLNDVHATCKIADTYIKARKKYIAKYGKSPWSKLSDRVKQVAADKAQYNQRLQIFIAQGRDFSLDDILSTAEHFKTVSACSSVFKKPENPANCTPDFSRRIVRGNWYDAMAYCNGKLPTMAQLKTMRKNKCTGGIRDDICSRAYWSSESSGSSKALRMSSSGEAHRYSKNNAFSVVCCH
jgi:hypothetical protein